jgi:hypothetical protein
MALSKAALNTELTTDPANMGYAAHVAANDDVALAAILNDRAAGVAKGYSLTKANITAAELQSCVTVADWLSITADAKSAWQNILIASSDTGVPTTNANIVAQCTAIWTGKQTLTNLGAAIVRGCSRAEQIGGEGYAPSAGEVSIALRN